MYHKSEEFDLQLMKEQISDLVDFEKEIESKMKEHLKELKSNQTHKNKNYFDFHSLRHQSSTEIAKVNYFYCAYCLSHSEKGLDDEIIRRYAKIDLHDLKIVLTKTYSQFLEELVSNTIEMEMYNYHSLSHKYIYETQFHIKDDVEYKSKKGEDLLGRIKIARANNDIENNPEFYQEITPLMQSKIDSMDTHLIEEEYSLKEKIELEKEMREKRVIDYSFYETKKGPKYKPFA